MDIALFDFDGTITTGDCYTPFIRQTASKLRLLTGLIVLSPVILAYKTRLLPSYIMRASLTRYALWQREKHTLEQQGRAHLKYLDSKLQQRAMQQIAWHKKRGDKVLVVSASLDLYLKPWCQEHGLELICSELAYENGRCLGTYLHGDCYSRNKVNLINERYDLSLYENVYAYGDTEEDEAMLNLASHKYYRWQKL